MPAPISSTSEAPSGISQSSATSNSPGRSRLYSSATTPKERLWTAVFSSWRTTGNLPRPGLDVTPGGVTR